MVDGGGLDVNWPGWPDQPPAGALVKMAVSWQASSRRSWTKWVPGAVSKPRWASSALMGLDVIASMQSWAAAA